MCDLMLELSAFNFTFTVLLISGLKTKVSLFFSRFAKIDFTSKPPRGWGGATIYGLYR